MDSTKYFRRGPGRYVAAALAAGAAVAMLGTGPAAYAAAAAPQVSLPVAPIALGSDWSGQAGFGSTAPGFYVETSLVLPDVVHLQGAARQVSRAGSDPDLLGTLPPAARPDRFVYELVHTFSGTYADVSISPSGQIDLIGPRPPAVQDFSFVSLEGITYEQSISATNFPVPVNTANWSGQAGFGAAAPSVWVDGSGIVHMEGAVTQTSDQGIGADVLGTLPPAFRPNRNVYMITHTFAGTYADLAISASTGQIIVIGARSPAGQDYRFLSLEDISYPQAGVEGPSDEPVAVNTANYSGSTAFGTLRPEVGIDAEGTVYLSGAVERTSASGTGVNTVGTVPVGFRPHRDVYLITHTFAGTYADLVITPAGQIGLIDPRPPLATDLRFVSLEGLSYQP
jgi:hypothetical protein